MGCEGRSGRGGPTKWGMDASHFRRTVGALPTPRRADSPVEKTWSESAYTGNRALDADFRRGGGQPRTPNIKYSTRTMWTPICFENTTPRTEGSTPRSCKPGEDAAKMLKRTHVTKAMWEAKDEEKE